MVDILAKEISGVKSALRRCKDATAKYEARLNDLIGKRCQHVAGWKCTVVRLACPVEWGYICVMPDNPNELADHFKQDMRDGEITISIDRLTEIRS